jgi:hypothetical protein
VLDCASRSQTKVEIIDAATMIDKKKLFKDITLLDLFFSVKADEL